MQLCPLLSLGAEVTHTHTHKQVKKKKSIVFSSKQVKVFTFWNKIADILICSSRILCGARCRVAEPMWRRFWRHYTHSKREETGDRRQTE